MRAWTAFASLPVACAIMMACSSDGGAPEPNAPEPDASTEPTLSPEAGTPDANDDVDAGPGDAGPSKPLDVVCSDASTCYVAVSGNGGRHVCGLLKDGTVRCWGRDSLAPPVANDGGETGDGALGRGVAVSKEEGATPAKVVGLSNVTQISVGPNYGTCARTSDGSVYCWGRNDFGQLGRPHTEQRLPAPTRVEGLPPADHVELGSSIACAIASSDGALYCWGWWREGLGVPEDFASSSFPPQRVTTFRAPVKALAIGSYGSSILQPWGWAELSDTIVALHEDDVAATLGKHVLRGAYSATGPSERTGVERIGTFSFTTSDGLAHRWLPNETTIYIPAFAPVVEVKVAAESEFEIALQGGVVTTTGRLFRWGPNPSGALGVDPNELSKTAYPVEVEQVAGKVVSFATTVGSTCALLVDGKIQCWGANAYGELGRGTTDLNSHPEPENVR